MTGAERLLKLRAGRPGAYAHGLRPLLFLYSIIVSISAVRALARPRLPFNEQRHYPIR